MGTKGTEQLIEEFEEAPGYSTSPGSVKGNPKNNSLYLNRCCKEYPEWEGILLDTDKKLESLVPGYNIVQIKDKFGYLFYYIRVPEGTSHDDAREAYSIAENATLIAGKLI